MKYRIIGGPFPSINITLETTGEEIKAKPGTLVCADSDVKLTTGIDGGLSGLIKRRLAKEESFLIRYRANHQYSSIVLAAQHPGKILDVDIREDCGLVCARGSFLCSNVTVNIAPYVLKNMSMFMSGKTDIVLKKMTGNGKAFVAASGGMIEKELKPGRKIVTDARNVVAFDETIQCGIKVIKNPLNIFAGRTGVIMLTLTGPGKIYLQTHRYDKG